MERTRQRLARRRKLAFRAGLLACIAFATGCEAPEAEEIVREGSPISSAEPAERPGDSKRIDPTEVTRANASEFARQSSRTDWSGGDVEAGAALYDGSCWVCHGGSGTGNGPAAASVNPKPQDFVEGRFYIDANANDVTGEPIDLARVILVGAAPFGGSEVMQAWHTVYSTGEIRNLVAYVLSLSEGSSDEG